MFEDFSSFSTVFSRFFVQKCIVAIEKGKALEVDGLGGRKRFLSQKNGKPRVSRRIREADGSVFALVNVDVPSDSGAEEREKRECHDTNVADWRDMVCLNGATCAVEVRLFSHWFRSSGLVLRSQGR